MPGDSRERPSITTRLAKAGQESVSQAVEVLVYIATALENTHSRNAVPPLITLLSSPDESVRRGAEQALATLTHQRSQYGIADADSARESNRDWSTWWARNGAAANIYGPDACIEPQVLH